MKLDTPFDPVSDQVALPDKLLDKCMQHRKGLKRIDVERKDPNSKGWSKVNGFAVEVDVSGHASDTAEDMASLVVAIAQWDVEEQGEDGTYRAKYWKDENGAEKRRTFSFKQSLGSGTIEPRMDENDADAMALIGMVLGQMNSLIQIQNSHIEAQNGRILDQSTQATSQIKQLLDTNETLINKYHEGLTMQANALTLMLDVERNLEGDRQRGKNTEKLLEILELAAPAAFSQFGAYIKQKALGGDEEDGDEEDEEGDGEEEKTGGGTTAIVKRASVGAKSDKSKKKLDPEEAEYQRNMQERPLTTFAHSFADSIQSQQWMDLAGTLTKKQMSLLKRATSSDGDEDTAAGILEFRTAVMKNPKLLKELQGALTERQVQMVMRLGQMAAQAEAAMKQTAPTPA